MRHSDGVNHAMMKTTKQTTTPADPALPSSAGRGPLALTLFSRYHDSAYPGSTVGGYTGHDSAAAVLSFASAFIACSRSNSVAQPTTSSACCTHSPRRMCRMHRAQAATQPTLVFLLRLFGDHLHLHLIPSHRLLSHELSSVSLPHILLHLSISRFPSPWRRLFPSRTLHTHGSSHPISSVCLRWVNRPIGVRYRLVPCGSPNRPIATCRLVSRRLPPFFITTDLKETVFCHIIFPPH